ncbi:MAG: hypothetical protein JKX88_11385 [Marinicaulis sp.]|nr:hypothetical protein [Marinicaulis sp.]
MAMSWGFSFQLWIVFQGMELSVSYALVDSCLAVAFLQMSRRHWFPVPLFFMHAFLVAYHFYGIAVGADIFWIALFLNRIFEVALAYIVVCALYRIYLRHTRNVIND